VSGCGLKEIIEHLFLVAITSEIGPLTLLNQVVRNSISKSCAWKQFNWKRNTLLCPQQGNHTYSRTLQYNIKKYI